MGKISSFKRYLSFVALVLFNFYASQGIRPMKNSTARFQHPTSTFTVYRFYGKSDQYARFASWSMRDSYQSQTLSFQIRSILPLTFSNSILMFAQAGENYISLTLSSNTVKLRYKFSLIEDELSSGGLTLEDGLWHSIKLKYNKYTITLWIDGTPTVKRIKGLNNFQFISKSGTIFGGIPKSFGKNQFLSSLVSSKIFIGEMRDFTLDKMPMNCLEKYKVTVDTHTKPCYGAE